MLNIFTGIFLLVFSIDVLYLGGIGYWTDCLLIKYLEFVLCGVGIVLSIILLVRSIRDWMNDRFK